MALMHFLFDTAGRFLVGIFLLRFFMQLVRANFRNPIALAVVKFTNPLVMPLAAVILALLSPLSWAYTYLTALVFMGALPARIGTSGIILAASMTLFFHRITPKSYLGKLDSGLTVAWIISGVFMLLLGLALAWAIWQGRPKTNTAP